MESPELPTAILINGDSRFELRKLQAESAQCAVSSPPYFQKRDYECEGQIGAEVSDEEYIGNILQVARGVWKVLKPNGVFFMNLDDTQAGSGGAGNQFNQLERGLAKYRQKGLPAGLKQKDAIGIPWRVALAMQRDGIADAKAASVILKAINSLNDAFSPYPVPDKVAVVLDGLYEEYSEAKGHSWWLRQEIIWAKPNPHPEPNKRDRFAKSHETIFMFTKAQHYLFNHEAVQERGENGLRLKRDVWFVPTSNRNVGHFATYPPELIRPCIAAASNAGDTVLDPFSGTASTGAEAIMQGRNYVGIELNPEYHRMGEERIANTFEKLALANLQMRFA